MIGIVVWILAMTAVWAAVFWVLTHDHKGEKW